MKIALRTYTILDNKTGDDLQPEKITNLNGKIWLANHPRLVCVFDCETTIDETQRLKFGACRIYHSMDLMRYRLLREVLFYDERNITVAEYKILLDYCNNHKQGDLESEGGNPIWLYTLEQFNRLAIRKVYEVDGVLAGFNLPFDITRIASGYCLPHKGSFEGGFRFHFSEYRDEKTGKNKIDPFAPRIGIKGIGQHMSRIAFIKPIRQHKGKTKGHCLDLAQLVNVLAGKPHSLKSACIAYHVKHGKFDVEEHGKITPEYIDYCREDVLGTSELYFALMEEYSHHPIPTPPEKIYSAASLGKGYLKAIGVTIPELKIEDSLSMSKSKIFGLLMSAFYAGRTECRIRKVVLPVVYADFKSMYSTVNILMNTWSIQTAKNVIVTDDTLAITRFLDDCMLSLTVLDFTSHSRPSVYRV